MALLSLQISLGRTGLRGVWILLTIIPPAIVLVSSTLQVIMNHRSRGSGAIMLFSECEIGTVYQNGHKTVLVNRANSV
jgi:hypothetical protein